MAGHVVGGESEAIVALLRTDPEQDAVEVVQIEAGRDSLEFGRYDLLQRPAAVGAHPVAELGQQVAHVEDGALLFTVQCNPGATDSKNKN